MSVRVFSKKIYKNKSKKRNTEGVLRCCEDTGNCPYIQYDEDLKLYVFQTCFDSPAEQIGVKRGKVVLSSIAKLCIQEGLDEFLVVHGLVSERYFSRRWSTCLKELFGNQGCRIWKNNKEISEVILHKVPASKLKSLLKA